MKDVRSSGRGIYAVEPLKKGELILNIPHSFLLNFTTVMAHIVKYNGMAIDLHIHVPFDKSEDEYTEIYRTLTKEEILELSSFQLLSLYLTFERKDLTNRFGNHFWICYHLWMISN